MFTPELACVDFQECSKLPPNTLVATVSILREIRCALGPTKLNLIIGDQEAVLVSSDLFAAFTAWEEQNVEDEGDAGDNNAWLN
ncbi:hypothetical protein [Planctomicrobium sp. SH664]|uniref:hypothetical protein n=1 Tax=Planctomicrobium sp. SH664 TaxID=3448125 RepID=UPI003F5BD061